MPPLCTIEPKRLVCFDRWTVDELKKVIAMLRHPDFNAKDVDPDLHRRMDKAVQDGRIKCFNMREGPADGDQDLNKAARAEKFKRAWETRRHRKSNKA